MDLSASNLSSEREQAVQLREALLADYQEVIERYHGSGYKDGGQTEEGEVGRDDPHNHALEIISTHLPAIAGGVPRVAITTERAGVSYEYARAHEVAANKQLRRSRGAKYREQVGVDFLLKYSATIVTEEPIAGFSDFDDPPNDPVEQRVSPRDFFFDPVGLEPATWAYMGHDTVAEKEQLLEWADADDSDWIKSAIESATTTAEAYDDDRHSHGGTSSREFVRYSQIWVPNATAEKVKEWAPDAYDAELFEDLDPELYHGVIFTVARCVGEPGQGGDSTVGAFLRKPYPYFGPPDGPYAVDGILVVPDEGAPMSIATATKGLADTLNAFKRAHDDAMESWKRLFAVSGEDPMVADTVMSASNGDVVVFENLTDLAQKLVPMELGGPSSDMLTSVTLQQENYDRMVGISDAMRGNVTGQGTATEVATANAFGSRRTGWIEHKFRGYIEQVERKKAWFRHYSERFAVVIGEAEVDGTAQSMPPQLMVGGSDVQTQMQTIQALYPELRGTNLQALLQQMQGVRPEFDALELEIDPWSMRHEDENSRLERAQMLDQAYALHAQWMIQFPFLPHRRMWHEKMRMLGFDGSAGEPDFEMAAEIAALMLGSQQPMQAEPERAQQPRLLGGGGPTGPVGGNFFGNSRGGGASVSGGSGAAGGVKVGGSRGASQSPPTTPGVTNTPSS